MASNTNLYIPGSQSKKRLLYSDILFQTSLEPTGTTRADVPDHCNFIYFCAEAQALGIDFLPITWQPHIGLGGSGGTSKIQQSLLSVDSSLAFKAINFGSSLQGRQDHELRTKFSLFRAEIQHMGDPRILRCPHIMPVEGICWNVNSVDGVVDPVLVYERAVLGDLYYYMTSGEGRSLDAAGRIKICRDIAIGLQTLHECNIVHGDIKPQNVLMILIEHQIVTAKITDFGYSRTYLTSQDRITVARTTPWNAPEVNERLEGYLSNEAKRTDVFSFGMLCLWMVFANELTSHFGINIDMTDLNMMNTEDYDLYFTRINKLKEEDCLRAICSDLISQLPFQPSQKVSVAKVFDLSLSREPLRRTSDMQQIRVLLDESLSDPSGFPPEMIPDLPNENVDMKNHCNFKIYESLLQFLQADVRVRSFFFHSLLEQAENSTCFACQSNAAFQVSVCYSIGFGIPADRQSCQQWLQRSGSSGVDLERVLSGMKRYLQEEGPYLYHTTFLNNLHNEGYLRTIDYLDACLPALSFEEVKILYEREIADLVSCLGPAADPTLCVEGVYATILREAGRYQEAADIQVRCLQHIQSTSNDGTESAEVQRYMSELVEIYRRQGDLQQAEQYNAMVKSRRTETFGADHPLTLVCVHTEGNLYRERGASEEAESTYKFVIEKRKQVLGIYHPGTLNAMSDLGTLYIHQMRYKEAAATLEEERHLCENLLGPNHYNTLSTLSNLANVYIGLGEASAAQRLLDRALFGLRLAYGEDNLMTSSVMASHGALCHSLEEYSESLDWYNKALHSTEKILGADHPNTLRIILSTATVLVAMEADFEETKALYERCIGAHKRLLGEDHPEYLEVQSEYCYFLLQRGHLDDAECGYRELARQQEISLGPEHVALAETLCNLGETLSKLGKRDAEGVLRRALEIAIQHGAGKYELGWDCMEKLADHLHHTGSDLGEAETLYKRILETKREDPNIEPLENYAVLDSLAELSIVQGNFEQAIAARKQLVELSEMFEEEEHKEGRAAAFTDLAWILNKSQRYDEAEPVYRRALELAMDSFGGSGENTLDIKANLAWNLEHQGQHEEALLLVFDALDKSKALFETGPIRLRVVARAAAVCFRQGDQATAIALSREMLDGTLVMFGADSEELHAAQVNHTLYSQSRLE